MKKNAARGLAMVIISGIVFGIMPGAVTFCYSQGADKLLVVMGRYLFLSLVLLPAAIREPNTLALYRKYWWKLLILSACSVATPILLFSAYQHLDTGMVTTIHFLYPTIVAVLCVTIFREKLSKLRLLCLLLCVGGILLMLNTAEQEFSTIGLILAFASGVAFALYVVLLDKMDLQGATSNQIVFFVGVDCLAMAVLYTLLTGGVSLAVTPVGWAALVGSTLTIAVFGTMFFSIGVRHTDAQVSAIASTLEPITSIVVGAVFLHETVTLRSGIGAALILTAVILLAVFENGKPAKTKKT